jgi:hypothetical protein
LLDELATTSNYLLNVAQTVKTFTRLDIVAARVLAIIGHPADSQRLVELANRRQERNDHTPQAIRALALVNKGEGIRAAAACLVEGWRDPYDLPMEYEFLDVLRKFDVKQVVEEVVKMDLSKEVLWHKVLQRCYVGYESEIAKDFLRQIAGSDFFPPSITKTAQERLSSSRNRAWLHPSEWIEDHVKEIRILLENDQLDSAVAHFDECVSSNEINYESSKLSQCLDDIAAVCDERLLDKWVQREEFGYQWKKKSLVLARLGRGPNGRVAEQALIKWAEGLNFAHTAAARFFSKEALLRALGELGTKDAAFALEAILKRALRLHERVLRAVSDAPYDNNQFWGCLLTALGKTALNEKLQSADRERIYRAIERGAKVSRNWVGYHVAARSISKQNAPKALKLLLKGHALRGNESWDTDFGDEPQLYEFAFALGARIRKVKQQDRTWYVVTSRSQKLRFRVLG